MRKISIVAMMVFLIAGFACTKKTSSQPITAIATPTPIPVPTKNDEESASVIRRELRAGKFGCQSPKEVGIDLCNYTYLGIHNKTPMRLKNGKEEYERGHGFVSNYLQGIELVDLTGDGQSEVLVRINHVYGGGSSCSTIHFYLYQLKNKMPKLIWKFATGCESHAGLKEFEIKDRQLYFELFGNCRIRNGAAEAAEAPKYGYTDIATTTYTKLKFGFHQGRFQLISCSVEPFEKETVH